MVWKDWFNIYQYIERLDKNIYLDAKGFGSMNQAQKDCHVDNNSKFAIYSLHLYAIVTMTEYK